MLGIPHDVVDATEHLLRTAPTAGSRGRSTSGRVNGRWFTFAAGVGLDASVVERVDSHPHLKARFGAWYYTEAAIVTFLRKLRGQPAAARDRDRRRRVRGV